MSRTAVSKITTAAACSLILLASIFAVLGGNTSHAFADTLTVTFYLDKDEAPYATVEIQENAFTVPENPPYKEGYTFGGWSDGFARFYPGKTYTASESMQLTAIWEQEEEIYQKPPLFNQAEKIVLYSVIGVLAVVFLFCYYWFGIKQYGVKELGARIKKIFSKREK